jgi:NarL family two-component system response regulator LiaR
MLAGTYKSEGSNRRLSEELQALAPRGWLVKRCRSVEEAIALLPKKTRSAKTVMQPECVAVVELAGKGNDGVNFVRRVRAAAAELPILALSEAKGRRALEALMVGASGHLYGPQSARQILTALECMVRGQAVLCQRSEQAIMRTLWRAGSFEAGDKLTPKQQVVMSGLLRGLLNKEIAAEMGTADGTVHSQLEEIYRKLEVHSRAEAVRKYLGLSGTG